MPAAIEAEVESLLPELAHLARSIGEHPELGYRERYASQRIARLVESRGHSVVRGYLGLETGLRVDSRSRPRSATAFLAEYDALPGIGHACGHNLIAAAAAGAYLVMARLQPEREFSLIGCPAEESVVDDAGGKIHLLDRGAFDDVGAALMIHPYGVDGLVASGSLVAQTLAIGFAGRASHASIAPHLGNNAVDAAVQLYLALQFMKAKLGSGQQLQAVISDGGKSPNVIPDAAELRVRLRAPSWEEFESLRDRIVSAARSVGAATETGFEMRPTTEVYRETRQDPQLIECAARAFARLGVRDRGGELSAGSTDFGNVSLRVPALEIGIGLGEGLVPHTVEFAEAACSDEAVDALRRAVVLLCLTASDMMGACAQS